MNYGDLKSNVAGWLKRSDLTSIIPTFIQLAEADIAHDVRVQAMEQRTTGTLTGETLDHPSDMLDARVLMIGDDQYFYVTPEDYEALPTGCEFYKFTSIGQKFYIYGGADGDTYTLVYWAKFAALSDDTDTNWITNNAPEVYLWSALRHAAIYTLDDTAMGKFAQQYGAAVDRLNKREQRARYAGPIWASAR